MPVSARRIRDPDRAVKILRASAALFYEKGFHAVTVDEIGAAVDATGAAIYRHFSGKDEILATLFDEALDAYLLALPEPREDPLTELDQLIDRNLRMTLDQRELASVWAREERALSDSYLRRLRRRERQYVERWVDCLRRCFPGVADAELTTAARTVIGAIVALASRPDVPAIDDPEVEVVRRLLTAGLHSLGAADRRPAEHTLRK
jgi:AcrR family transcriptional regulator